MSAFSDTQVTFRLPRGLARRVQSLARRSGRKRSEVLREAVLSYVDATEVAESQNPFEQVKELIGSVNSGVSDLGSRHSEHLKNLLRRGR